MATTKNNALEFSARLRKLRGDRSQGEFAKILGIPSQQTYANYENGRIPKTPILQQISQQTGVSLEWLLTGESAPDDAATTSNVREEHVPETAFDALAVMITMINRMTAVKLTEMWDLYSTEAAGGNSEAGRLLGLLTPHIRNRIELLKKKPKQRE